MRRSPFFQAMPFHVAFELMRVTEGVVFMIPQPALSNGEAVVPTECK
jgi:hypothetical protein